MIRREDIPESLRIIVRSARGASTGVRNAAPTRLRLSKPDGLPTQGARATALRRSGEWFARPPHRAHRIASLAQQ
jgi:hypothetical protein